MLVQCVRLLLLLVSPVLPALYLADLKRGYNLPKIADFFV
jgi:hypothetical protein